MRPRLVGLALAVALALVWGLGAASAQDLPTAADLERKLVCPVCETTLDQSNAPVAERMKLYIRERIAAGDSEDEIVDALVAEFGPGVVATPPKSGFGLLAWVVPLVALLGGAVAVGVLVLRWARRRADDAYTERAPPLDPLLEQRVDEELARFDG